MRRAFLLVAALLMTLLATTACLSVPDTGPVVSADDQVRTQPEADVERRAQRPQEGQSAQEVVTAFLQEARHIRCMARRPSDVRRPDAGDDQHLHGSTGSSGGYLRPFLHAHGVHANSEDVGTCMWPAPVDERGQRLTPP